MKYAVEGLKCHDTHAKCNKDFFRHTEVRGINRHKGVQTASLVIA